MAPLCLILRRLTCRPQGRQEGLVPDIEAMVGRWLALLRFLTPRRTRPAHLLTQEDVVHIGRILSQIGRSHPRALAQSFQAALLMPDGCPPSCRLSA